MNQRTANRSRHATVLCRQLVECRNGGRVAKDNGNLPTFRAIGVLPAGFRGIHSALRHLAHVFDARSVRLPAGQVGGYGLAPYLGGGRDSEKPLIRSDTNQLAGLVAQAGGQFAALGKNTVHGSLRSGPIPPMDESCSVTSDVSTLCYEIFSEAA